MKLYISNIYTVSVKFYNTIKIEFFYQVTTIDRENIWPVDILPLSNLINIFQSTLTEEIC